MEDKLPVNYQEKLSLAIQENAIEDICQLLKTKGVKDNAKIAVGAALGAIPVVGSSLQTLLFEYSPRTQENRLYSFIAHLAVGYSNLSEQIKESTILSESYDHLIRVIMHKVVQEHQAEKINAYKNILLNSAQGLETSIVDAEFIYLQTLEELLNYHIHILQLLFQGHLTLRGKRSLLVHLSNGLKTSNENVRILAIRLDNLGLTKKLATSLNTLLDAKDLSSRNKFLTSYGLEFTGYIINK